MPKGYVYILTNPSFREKWVKIGRSNRPVNVRSKELDNTAVPLPYEIFAVLETEKFVEAEKLIHKQIDELTDLRIRKSREFFNIAPEKAVSIFRNIADFLGEDARVIYGKEISEQKSKENQRKSTTLTNSTTELKNKSIVKIAADKKTTQASQTNSHTFDEHLKKGNDDIKKCLEHLRNFILRIDETVKETPQGNYISYKKNKTNFVSVEVHKDKFHLDLKMKNPEKIETLRNGKNMTGKGHFCTGCNARITINNLSEVEISKEYIKKAFEYIGG